MEAIVWEWRWYALASVLVTLVVFFAIGAAGAWWLRGSIMQRRIDSVTAQRDEHEDRLLSVTEKLQGADKNLEAVQRGLDDLAIQLERNAPRRRLEELTAELSVKAATVQSTREIVQHLIRKPTAE